MFDMRGEASIHIDAPPDKVYDVITDLSRMGEWSPECVSIKWGEGASGPAIGATFFGTNRRDDNEWTTPNTVLAATAGREFAWVVGSADYRVCTWRYQLAPDGSGTCLTESFELGPESMGFRSTVFEQPEQRRDQMVDARRVQLLDDMHQTLARIKEAIESR